MVESDVLPAGAPTLAELFREQGFRTLGIAKSSHLLPEYGFSRGFDEYVSRRELTGDRRRVDAALQRIGRIDGPFFAYLHLNACHHPFREKERDLDYMARHGFPYPEAGVG